MQNVPITAIPPSSPAQPTVSADSNMTQPAEPFSNVLARQRANASTPNNTGAQNSKQVATSSATDAAPGSGNEQSSELQTPETASALPNGLIPQGLLPGDMLAALSPTPLASDSNKGNKKTNPLAPATDATAAALPGDMLAALLPPSATMSSSATSEKDHLQQAAPDAAGTLPDNMLATSISQPAPQERSTDLHPQPAALVAAGRLVNAADIADASLLSRKQGITRPAAMSVPGAPGSSFSAALETMDKVGAKTSQLDTRATEFSTQATQPSAANNIAALTPIGTNPIAISANGPAQATVSTPVGRDAWGDEFGQKITWLATQHAQSAELHLNPPQLGPLDIVLNVSGDQATALFTSPHAAVRDAVEQALPILREMLADNGIMLGNAMISDQSPKEQQAWLTGQQQNGSGNLSGKAGSVTATDDILSDGTTLPVRRHQGMVDTFA